MIARFIHDGDAIDYTPTVDTPAGTVVVMGYRVGIAKVDIPANVLGALAVVGVYDFIKDNVAINEYDKVYWSSALKKVVTTAGGNVFLGLALHAAEATDSMIRVRLE